MIERSLRRRLHVPVLLLLATFALGSNVHLTDVRAADAAQPVKPAPARPVKAAPAPAQAVPAVLTPAAPAVFAKDVEGLSPKVLAMALDAMACAKAKGVSGSDELLTIIDYSLPSTQPRLWVLDLKHGDVLFHELVAHGRGSGENYATRFSNLNDSHQSSLGLYLTGGTYTGGNGYSMVLKGLDAGVNDKAEARHIVMHGAWYVSNEQARSQGRLGRSWGCPALSQEMAPRVIDTIKGGTFVFSYAGESSWLKTASASTKTCGGSGEPGPGVAAAAAATVVGVAN
ncbi:MAG: murein L,D-transpeptidase catalytic domain family protein [Acidobacteriota bacterium]